ncbi:MAG: hypothetical protein JO363_00665 [Solirubrobacterales bacterium]|nr:hypothetical protein [Solirubrobacterales bacterium]
MTDTNPESARARGQALRSARVARARSIRRRIIAGSLALFVAAWLLITLVLVSGHDPALAKKSSAGSSSSGTTVASTPTSGTSATSGSTSSDTSGSTSSSTGSSSSSSGGSVSSLTTSQS